MNCQLEEQPLRKIQMKGGKKATCIKNVKVKQLKGKDIKKAGNKSEYKFFSGSLVNSVLFPFCVSDWSLSLWVKTRSTLCSR
jgi:hypothetical protein